MTSNSYNWSYMRPVRKALAGRNQALLKLRCAHESAENLCKMQIWFSRSGVLPKCAFLTSGWGAGATLGAVGVSAA